MKKNYNEKKVKKPNPSPSGLERQIFNLVVTMKYSRVKEN